LSLSEEEAIIKIEDGTHAKYESHVQEGTNVELVSQGKIFSSNLTSLILIISLD
jgi:hypothetical protein